MSNEGTYTDFRLANTVVDEIDGKFWIFDEKKQDKKYPVVNLLDACGDPTEDLDGAAGGVFQLDNGGFMVFTL